MQAILSQNYKTGKIAISIGLLIVISIFALIQNEYKIFETGTKIVRFANKIDALSDLSDAVNKELQNNTKSNNLSDNKGKERATKYGSKWKKANLKKTIEQFGGKDPKITRTETDKTLYLNEKNGIQVVVDNNGNYFRIQDTKCLGKRNYLDLEGKIPNNKTIDGKTIGNSQDEYNQLTHFLFD